MIFFYSWERNRHGVLQNRYRTISQFVSFTGKRRRLFWLYVIKLTGYEEVVADWVDVGLDGWETRQRDEEDEEDAQELYPALYSGPGGKEQKHNSISNDFLREIEWSLQF